VCVCVCPDLQIPVDNPINMAVMNTLQNLLNAVTKKERETMKRKVRQRGSVTMVARRNKKKIKKQSVKRGNLEENRDNRDFISLL